MVNNPEDRKQDDKELEEYLQGDSALTESYRSEEKIQPPDHLDKAIVAAAYDAVRSEQASEVAYSPFARTWYVPASMVAVLMLCIGLVFTIYQDSGQTLLTTPESEYDFDTQIVPIISEPVESTEEVQDAANMSMDKIPDVYEPVSPSIGSYEQEEREEIQQRPMSRMLLKEKASELDEASPAKSAPVIIDKIIQNKDASKQTMSDLSHIPGRRDESGAADVKKQKPLDASGLNNKPGEIERKSTEEAYRGANSVDESRYRQAYDDLQRRNEALKEDSMQKEALDENMTTEGFAIQEKAISDDVLTPEQWLNKINELWASGKFQAVDENCKQFIETYPDYSIEKIKSTLDPQIEFMKYTR